MGVGMCPPRVGEPSRKPLERSRAAVISVVSACSALIDSTATPALVTPRARAWARVAVLP